MFTINCTDERHYIIEVFTGFLQSKSLTDHNTQITNLDYETEGCIEVIEILKDNILIHLDISGLDLAEDISINALVELILCLNALAMVDIGQVEDYFIQQEVVTPLETFVRVLEEVSPTTYDVNAFRYVIDGLTPSFINYMEETIKKTIVEQFGLSRLDKLMLVKDKFTEELEEVFLYIVESNDVDVEYLMSNMATEEFNLTGQSRIDLDNILKIYIGEEDESRSTDTTDIN